MEPTNALRPLSPAPSTMSPTRTATLFAMGAIFLWGILAPLDVLLQLVQPFLLSGLGLLVRGLIALPLSGSRLSSIAVPPSTRVLGVCGFCGFHFLLFIALRRALQMVAAPSTTDRALIAAMGLGPLGAAFYLWNAALKRGDARQIGVLSFLTPLLSTLALLWVRQKAPTLGLRWRRP